MAKKEKIVVSLDDGETKVKVAEGNWQPEAVKDIPVLLAGWKEGQASHHSITLGMALACKEKIPEAYLGDYEGVPVIDPKVIHEKMADAFCEQYGVEPIQFRVAANRSGAKKELNALKEMATANPETLEALKKINPELAEKLSK
jgi:hypothetical protein